MAEGLEVYDIKPNSIAEELEINPGDRVVEINGQKVNDIIDYRFLTADDEITVKLVTTDGEEWLMEIEKDFGEDLGLEFGDDTLGGLKRCRNKCIFCFVDQMPPNMRKSLYVKDDDYRTSFLNASFVTLTNISDAELQRIINQKLSPLYVSVHTTNPELRRKMMTNPKAADIIHQLNALTAAGIEMHTQVVLVPGVNDGKELDRTIKELSQFWPQVRSLAVVPVGLTKYREGLAPVRVFNREEALEVVKQIEKWQQKFRAEFDYPFVFASDEFYIEAEVPIPPDEYYADYPQTENGVGMTRIFLDQWADAERHLPLKLDQAKKVSVVTGVSAHGIIKPIVERLNQIEGLDVTLYCVPNRYFGETVTVAGLLTGSDLLYHLKDKDLGELLLIPHAMLKDQTENVFLDDIAVDDVAKKLKVRILSIDTPHDFIKMITKY